MSDNRTDVAKVIRRPVMNGLEMRWGKNVLPVMMLHWAPLTPALAGLTSNCFIGLYPRNALKRLPTGGSLATWAALAGATPFALRPAAMEWGRDADSPRTMSEKKMPIDSTMPEFWNVARIPDAAPRWRAGTLFMMPVAFGAAKRPKPITLRRMRAPNTGKMKLAGRNSSNRYERAATSMPPVANGRAPNRSVNHPETGPASRNPAVRGSM